MTLWKGGIWASQKGSGNFAGVPVEEEDFSEYEIGDLVGGGIYAGKITLSDDAEYHIVFALQEGELSPTEGDTRWKTERTPTPGANSLSDGLANMASIKEEGLEKHPAALYCEEYRGGNHSDWYLPALNELELESNLRANPELSVSRSTYRWTSTEHSSTSAWVVRFSDGNSSNNAKDGEIRKVRPVRRIPVIN